MRTLNDFPVKWLTREQFNSLPEYSCSLPTGTTIGKQWKAHYEAGWFLGEYYDIGSDKEIGIRWSLIKITDLKWGKPYHVN